MTTENCLSTLVASLLSNNSPVMSVEGEVISGKHFSASVIANCQRLNQADTEVVAIYTVCAYKFAIALFSALHAQKEIIVLPHLQPGFVEKVAGDFDLLMTDDADYDSLPKLIIEEAELTNELELISPHIAPDASLSFFTSDTSGAFYTTVSHQHFYGFIFRLMLPLTVGRLIDARQYHYPEPLMAALEISELIENPVQEIFGSTETGAVAYRTQQLDTQALTPWNLLPTVAMKIAPESQCLMINSSYCEGDDWFEMGDTVEGVNHSQFILKHRADKIVKIEEKRLSLPEMETALLSHPFVESCACVTTVSKRLIVVAAVTLSQEGEAILSNSNKHNVNQILRTHLLQFFEAVLIPKKWRYVDSLPLNSQGKIITADIEALFAPTQKQLDRPEVTSVEKLDNSIILNLSIRKELRYFDGHFEEKPILPGVVQVDWAAKYALQHLPVEGVFQRLEVIKFHEFIEPESTVELSLTHKPGKGQIEFQYSSDKGVHSSGRIVFG